MRISKLLAFILAVMLALTNTSGAALAARPAGDVDGDYEVNNRDLVTLARYCVGLCSDEAEAEVVRTCADMNGDGSIDNGDLVLLARLLVQGSGGLDKPAGEPVDLVEFSSLEEFNEAILNAEDVGVLAGIDKYCLPTNLPEGYALYKITVGAVDIGFRYLPEDCLIDTAAANSAEAQGKDFLFIYDRDTGSELAEGTYMVIEGVRDIIKWNTDGHTIQLYVPKGYDSDYGELVGAEVVHVK